LRIIECCCCTGVVLKQGWDSVILNRLLFFYLLFCWWNNAIKIKVSALIWWWVLCEKSTRGLSNIAHLNYFWSSSLCRKFPAPFIKIWRQNTSCSGGWTKLTLIFPDSMLKVSLKLNFLFMCDNLLLVLRSKIDLG
jgi:hypothetical protein